MLDTKTGNVNFLIVELKASLSLHLVVGNPPLNYNIQGKCTSLYFRTKATCLQFLLHKFRVILITTLLLNCFLCLFLQKSNYGPLLGGVNQKVKRRLHKINIPIVSLALIGKFPFISKTIHTKMLIIDIRICQYITNCIPMKHPTPQTDPSALCGSPQNGKYFFQMQARSKKRL